MPRALENLRGTEIGYILFKDRLLTSPLIMNARHYDKSELLKTLLEVTYKICNEEVFVYQPEII